MRSFNDSWDQEIANITTAQEFQNATVEFYEPAVVSDADYNITTGIWTKTGTPIASLKARVVPVRSPAHREAGETLNATSVTAVRIQVPRDSAVEGRLHKGVEAFVTECDRNPALLSRTFTLVSEIQGSASASRTFLFATDEDVVLDD